MIRDFFSSKLESNDKENSNKYFYTNLVIIAIMYIVALVFLKRLPGVIPIMHDGPKQIYIDSRLGVFLIPTIALITSVLFKIQKRLYSFHSIIYFIVLIGMSIYYYSLI